MNLPSKVWKEMMYLCSQQSDLEWSGVLFYKPTGDVDDLENFVVDAECILLKDVGTATFTSYETNEEEAIFMMENPHLQDMYLGKVHSHNAMGVFHSGTDWDDLWDNTASHNYYLSLIVNNKGDVEVKIAWRSKNISTTTSKFHIKDRNGKLIEKIKTTEKEENLLITANGIIYVEEEDGVSDEFKKRLADVLKQKEEKRKREVKTPIYNKNFVKNITNTKAPIPANSKDKEFLVDVLSFGESKANLDSVINRIDKLNAGDFYIWELEIAKGHYWDYAFEKTYVNGFTSEPAVAENCLRIMKSYKLSNPTIYKAVEEFLTSLLDEGNSMTQEELEFIRAYGN